MIYIGYQLKYPNYNQMDIELQKQIGKGQFGIVYLGYRKGDDTPLAIKVIDKTQFTIRRLLNAIREYTVLRHLDCIHKNILCVKDIMETESQIMIISEYIPGGITLARYVVKMDTLEEQLIALDILYQLADGLEYMHQHNVIHRDIKPANIMMKGHIPIYIDFDLACFEDDNEKYRCVGKAGTPNYMAPEVWMKEVHDWNAVDIYSLGATAFYMYNGHKTPYPLMSPDELELQVLTTDPRRSDSGILALDDLIMKMMSRDPEDRPSASQIKSTVQEIIKAL